MVDISDRLRQIRAMVDAGDYFTINRARQYGKSTTLSALRKDLAPEYEAVSISFEGVGNAGFATEENFVQSFCRLLMRERMTGVLYPLRIEERLQELIDRTERLAKLDELFDILLLADGNNPLFGSIMGKLVNYPTLKPQLRDILMKGDVIAWKPDDVEQQQLYMFGFIRNRNNTVAISNRIFEMRLYQYFLGEETKNEAFRQDALLKKNIFINDDHTLNMPLMMDHFVKTQRMIHEDEQENFLEEEGRERFLTYISPIINGTGTYSIEEQTRDKLRMDVVIHYPGKRYIVEMKIWRGQRYNEEGEKQIMEYLDRYDLTTGYMISFNFNRSKKPGVERVRIGDKTLYQATV